MVVTAKQAIEMLQNKVFSGDTQPDGLMFVSFLTEEDVEKIGNNILKDLGKNVTSKCLYSDDIEIILKTIDRDADIDFIKSIASYIRSQLTIPDYDKQEELKHFYNGGER